ncbi:hypothetical protein G6F46_014903 [Rhizopus delemar]|nr:hypothetical protein G6F46_014903 [Rhizopus delemar]
MQKAGQRPACRVQGITLTGTAANTAGRPGSTARSGRVAHGLDGVLRPAFAQAEALADARLHTQQAAHLRVGALRLAVGILRRDA